MKKVERAVSESGLGNTVYGENRPKFQIPKYGSPKYLSSLENVNSITAKTRLKNINDRDRK